MATADTELVELLETIDNTTVLGSDDWDAVNQSMIKLRGNWYEVGIGLKVEKEFLDELEDKNLSAERSMSKILVRWLENYAKPTWRMLAEIAGRYRMDVARDIAQNHPGGATCAAENEKINFSNPSKLDVQKLLKNQSQGQFLYLCHKMHEARKDVNLGCIDEKLLLTPSKMTTGDFQAVAYFLSHSKATWKEVCLGEGLTDEMLEIFCEGFLRITKEDMVIEKLSLNCIKMTNSLPLKKLEGIPCFPTVSVRACVHVDICNCTSDCDGMKVKNVSEFHIPLNSVPPAVVIESLENNTNLETFSCAIVATPETMKALETSLSENKRLKSLTFNISQGLYNSIFKGLAHNHTLKELTLLERLSFNVMTGKKCVEFWKFLGQHIANLHIERLTIDSLFFPPVSGEEEATALAETLTKSTSLTHVTLKGIKFNPFELDIIKVGLIDNKVLSELKISDKARFEYASFVRSEHSGNIELQEGVPKDTSQHLLKAAMDKGCVKARISTVLLHGPAGSGKTCSTCLLVGEDPPPVRHSTPVAARPMRMFRFDVTHDEWKKLTPQQRKDVLARAAKSQPKQVDINPTEEEYPDTGILQSDSETVSPQQSSVADIPDLTTADELADLIESYSGETPLLQLQTPLLQLDMMHIIDTGGQPQCHELMRYFVKRCVSLYIFVFKLSEEFDARPLIAYYNESGKCVSGEQRTTQTNEQILQHCARTMQSDKRADQKVKMLFLGTHEDQEACCPEPRMEKNKKLIKMIPPKFVDDLIYYNLPTNELIFPVNALLPGPHEKEVVAHIRKLISTQCISEGFDLPLQWYGLEIILEELSERLDRKVMLWNECLAASKMLHLTEADFNAAVDYLDEHCLIFYFRDIPAQLVFSDVQVLLDKATELIEASCEVRSQNSTQPCVREGRWKKFQELGIVTCNFLSQDRFKKHYVPGIFTPVELTELFRKLLIFADFEKDQYFMPSLLESLSSVDLQPHRVDPSAAALMITPLVLLFPNGGPQLGIFCYLIAYLLSSDNKFPSAWKLKFKDDGITPECLKRNCVLFEIPKISGSVLFIDSFHHLEVHVDGVPQFLACKCSRTILQALFHGLTKANERLGYSDVPPELGLACPCKEREFHHATLVIDDDNDKNNCWICSKNNFKCEKLLPNQSIWPKESHTDKDVTPINAGIGTSGEMDLEWKHALQKFRPKLAEVIDAKCSPDRFGDALVGKGFITEQVKRDRVNVPVDDYTKVTRLLDAVSTDINNAPNKEKRFNDFVGILNTLGLTDIAKQLNIELQEGVPKVTSGTVRKRPRETVGDEGGLQTSYRKFT